jgi:SAM-dependent methyltransferase
MPRLLTPRRRRGHEYLDEKDVEPAVQLRSLRDVALSNTLFGGAQAVLSELLQAIRALGAPRLSLLDVGTGMADIPARARIVAAREGTELRTFGVDTRLALVRAAAGRDLAVACADALALPFADRSIDIVMCSQLLHHFERDAAVATVREMHRIARHRVIVSDLRRSWLAAAGIWLASFPLRFHPVSRHDGVVSVLRGFTAAELQELVSSAVGVSPTVRYHPGFRTTASWAVTGAG